MQPVFGVAAIQEHLQGTDADREQERTCPIGGRTRPRRLLEKGRQQHEVDDADRQIDVKDPAPVEVVGDEAADGRPHDRAEQDADAPNGHRLAAVGRRECIHHNGLRQGNDAGTECALQKPEANHLRQGRRLTAQHRRDNEADDAYDDHGLAPKRAARNPLVGMTIASATMYEVMTQVI